MLAEEMVTDVLHRAHYCCVTFRTANVLYRVPYPYLALARLKGARLPRASILGTEGNANFPHLPTALPLR